MWATRCMLLGLISHPAARPRLRRSQHSPLARVPRPWWARCCPATDGTCSSQWRRANRQLALRERQRPTSSPAGAHRKQQVHLDKGPKDSGCCMQTDKRTDQLCAVESADGVCTGRWVHRRGLHKSCEHTDQVCAAKRSYEVCAAWSAQRVRAVESAQGTYGLRSNSLETGPELWLQVAPGHSICQLHQQPGAGGGHSQHQR